MYSNSLIKEISSRFVDPDKINTIVNHLENSQWKEKLLHPHIWDELSLSDGYPGMLLLFTTLRKTDLALENNEAIEHAYVLKIRELLESQKCHSLSLFSGLAGICFSIHEASQDGIRYKKMLEKLHTLLISQSEKIYLDQLRINFLHKTASLSSLIDPIQGICGIGRYVLEHISQNYFREFVEKIIKTLIELCSPFLANNHIVPGWYLPPTDPLNIRCPDLCPNGNFNLGLAHGVAGILAFLSIAYLNGIDVDEQKETIFLLANWIRSKSTIKETSIIWPTVVSFEEEVEMKPISVIQEYKDAWCYGVPGISRSLLLAGKALGDTNLINFAITAFRGVFSRSKEVRNLHGPGLCHGIAGLLLITKEMSKEKNCEDLERQVEILKNDLLALYNPNSPFGYDDMEPTVNGELIAVSKPGLLEGSSGVLLTLLSLSKMQHKWQLPMLVST